MRAWCYGNCALFEQAAPAWLRTHCQGSCAVHSQGCVSKRKCPATWRMPNSLHDRLACHAHSPLALRNLAGAAAWLQAAHLEAAAELVSRLVRPSGHRAVEQAPAPQLAEGVPDDARSEALRNRLPCSDRHAACRISGRERRHDERHRCRDCR